MYERYIRRPCLPTYRRVFKVIFIYRVIALVARILLPLVALFIPKIKSMLGARENLLAQIKNRPVNESEKWFWFHCASGEFEYAIPIIEKLKKNYSHVKILVTYFSPSYVTVIERSPLVDYALPAPLENVEELQTLIQHFNPKALLLARTDTWYEMLTQARAANIPTILFSATLIPESGRLKWPTIFLTKKTFSLIDLISCVSEEDAKLFRMHTKSKVIPQGDTRWERVILRLALAPDVLRPYPALLNFRPEQVLVVGSSWSEDETAVLDALEKSKVKFKTIFVPHELHHLSELTASCERRGFKSRLLSQTQDQNWDILIVDKFGLLFAIYTLADVCVVGGSFKKSVHSVMEAIASGAPVIVGPHFKNNREAQERLASHRDFPKMGAVFTAANTGELTRLFDQVSIREKNLINSDISLNTSELLYTEIKILLNQNRL